MSGEETKIADVEEPVNPLEAAAQRFFDKEIPQSADLDGGTEATGLVDDDDDDDDDADEDEEQESSVVDDGSGDGSGADDSSPLAPLPDDQLLDIDHDVKVTRGELKSLVNFSEFMRANPQVSQALADFIDGNIDIVPKGQQQQPPTTKPDGTPYSTPAPEDLDLDDPTIKRLWDEQQGLRQTVAQLQSLVGVHDQHYTSQKIETTQSFINQAKKTFAEQHQLTDAQMNQVEEVTARLGVLSTIMAPMDPVSGLPRKVDPLNALSEAFNAGYHMIPEYRDRQLLKRVEAEKTDKKRKQKLTSLSGSSGSVPRSTGTKAPTNAAERRAAMIAEVATAMFPETNG